ncbi:hypothetical protein ACMA1D_08900 [Streptomyces sp. 796.1]|uniref:hypothetical protein n=1 Tax=Streptomyces sp. 796.1 TaxID=3163029 RepID=UPI0039C98CC7
MSQREEGERRTSNPGLPIGATVLFGVVLSLVMREVYGFGYWITLLTTVVGSLVIGGADQLIRRAATGRRERATGDGG